MPFVDGAEMPNNVSFSSVLSEEHREELESLLFFNPRQKRTLAGINHAIKDFGLPSVHEENGLLRVRVEGLPGAQTIFALDQGMAPPVLAGVMVFVRLDVENIVLVHIAVGEDYARDGKYGDGHLVSRFVAELRAIARRIKGVRSVILKYSGGLTIPVGPAP